jgi:hypothetical protein
MTQKSFDLHHRCGCVQTVVEAFGRIVRGLPTIFEVFRMIMESEDWKKIKSPLSNPDKDFCNHFDRILRSSILHFDRNGKTEKF